jgi:hypothetical protein
MGNQLRLVSPDRKSPRDVNLSAHLSAPLPSGVSDLLGVSTSALVVTILVLIDKWAFHFSRR